MLSCADEITAVLVADATVADLAAGGVHVRRLAHDVSRTSGHLTPDATPEAFDAAGMVRTTIVVVGGVETPDRRGVRGSFRALPSLWFHCRSDDASRANGEALARRVCTLFRERRIGLSPAGSALVTLGSGRDFVDDPGLPQALVATVQLSVVGYRPA